MAHAPDEDRKPNQLEISTGPASKPSQSLGRWVDDLLGDKKIRERAARKAAERRKFFTPTP
jgi:hypothetical protein